MAEDWFARNFVWRSSEDSIEAGKVSVLACVEMIFSVFAYWWIAANFQIYSHIIISIIVAPLVLLRSDHSVTLGINMFDNYVININNDFYKSKIIYFQLALCILFSLIVFIFLVIDAYDWDEFFLAYLISTLFLSFWCVVFGLVNAAQIAAGAFALPAMISKIFGESGINGPASALFSLTVIVILAAGVSAAGFAFRILFIRTFATLHYLPDGFKNLPNNWWQTVFLTDITILPELVPDIENVRPEYSLREFPYVLVGEISGDSPSFIKGIGGLAILISLIIIFIPTIIYRYSVKSTCWLYMPLIYLVNVPTDLRTVEGRRSFVKITPMLRTEWARFAMALASLAVAAFALVDANKLNDLLGAADQGLVPITVFSLIFVLNFSEIHPWQMLTLPTAGLTVVLFFWLDRMRQEEISGKKLEMFGIKMNMALAIYRLRDFMVKIWLIMSLYYTVSYAYSKCEFPEWANYLLNWHFAPPTCLI